MLGQTFFDYSKNGGRGNSPICIPMTVCTKQERSALWTIPDFLRDLTMCFGSRRAEAVCPWPETFIPGWGWSALAFCSCMGEKQTPPQSMSFSMLLLLVLSELWGFASYYVHIFVTFWPARGSVFYGMCPTRCCLTLTEVTAFPLGACAAAGVESACTDSPGSSEGKWWHSTELSLGMTLLLRENSGVSLWGWQCRVRGLGFASNEFTMVLATA